MKACWRVLQGWALLALLLANGFTSTAAATSVEPGEFRCHCNNWPVCLSSCRADVAVTKAMVESRAILGYRVFTVTYVVCRTATVEPLKNCLINSPYVSFRTSFQLSLYIDETGPPVVLSLTKVDFISPRGSFQLRYTEKGQLAVSEEISRCFYEGSIVGDPDSHAFVDVCFDRVRGLFTYRGADYIIQPIECHTCTTYRPHAVLPVAQERKPADSPIRPIVRDPAVKTFFTPYVELLPGGGHVQQSMREVVQSNWPPSTPPQKVFFVRLAVIIDHSLFYSLGRSLAAASSLAGRVVGQANRLLLNSRVSIILHSLEVWNMADKTDLGGSLRAGLLSALGLARARSLPLDESLLLLTGANYSTSSDHLTVLDSVCSRRAVSIVRSVGDGIQWPRTARLTALAVAEQLGMLVIPCPTGGDCNPDRLLTRSDSQRLEASLRSGLANCLLSSRRENGSGGDGSGSTEINPEAPICGNGKLERSEECDPGSDAAADAIPCCDKTACVLHSWATCRGGGACCSGCTLKQSGSVCREAVNDCDLPELCDGSAETCPDDAGLADWQPCGVGGKSAAVAQQRLCHHGQCPPARDSACQQVWGSGSDSGPADCYTNSGKDSCATLMCSGGGSGASVGAHLLIVRRPNGTSLTCRFQSSDAALPDGTPCPGGGSCSGGRCHSPAALAALAAGSLSCPRGESGLVCSSRGVCTTRSACLCQPGWSGAACQRRAGGDEPVDPLQLHFWRAAGVGNSENDGKSSVANVGTSMSIEMICIIVGAVVLVLVLVGFVAFTCRNRSQRRRLRGGLNGMPLWNSSTASSQQGNRLTSAESTYAYGIGSGSSGGNKKRRRQKNDLGDEHDNRTISFAPSLTPLQQQQQPPQSMAPQQQFINSLDSSTMGSGKQLPLQPLRQPPSDPPLPDKGILRNRGDVGELQEMANLLDRKLGGRCGSVSTLEDDYGCSEQPAGKCNPPVIFCNSSMQTDKTPKHQQQQQQLLYNPHLMQQHPGPAAYLECLPESERYTDSQCVGGAGGCGSAGSYSNPNAYSCPYAPGSVGSAGNGGGGKMAASPSNLLATSARKPDAEKGLSLPPYSSLDSAARAAAAAAQFGHYSDGSSVCSSVCGRGSVGGGVVCGVGSGSISGRQPMSIDLAIGGSSGSGGGSGCGSYLGKR